MAKVLVTGSNKGIGLELVKQLKARGDEVIAVCRQSSPELDALGVEVITEVDQGDDASVARFAAKMKGKKLDVVINNAAIGEFGGVATLKADTYVDGGIGTALDVASIQRQFNVNSVGPLRITQALLPCLSKGGKVAFVSSRAGSIGDNGSGGLYGYRMSKAALNMAAVSLTRDLAPEGISVAILHPGFIRTGMTKGAGNDDPPVAAKGLIARIDELTPETSGTFWHANGEKLPW
ncbi:MAG: SDR family oxidoreductase [Polyangiaceae bacterium]